MTLSKFSLTSEYRTHTCGELRESDEGKVVTLSGWIHRKRDHGGVLFIDLRDNYGITQVVFHGDLINEVEKLRLETVIRVKGEVVARSEDTVNPNMVTGMVEIYVAQFDVLSAADLIPFQIADDDNAPEQTRLEYRFLELRRQKLHDEILFRSRIIREIRKYMEEADFVDFQTPILTSSSPEGARDFLVPSRVHPGKFFALPQAPQQFKQLLMIAGFDRYYQIAPCFRDEAPRADRTPGEFYQCDFEMSFVEQDEVFAVGEGLFHHIFSTFAPDAAVTPLPFPRIKFRDAMLHYGTDKPDLRNPLRIEEVSDIYANTEFQVFQKAIKEPGGDVFCIKVDVDKLPPRKYFDDLIEWFKKQSGSGLAYLCFEGDSVKGSIQKFMAPGEIEALKTRLGTGAVTLVFFAAGKTSELLPHLGRLRTKLGEDFDLLEKNAFRFCWIVDFPMYERNEETGQIEFSHNPFSMPQGGLDALLNRDPLDILAWQYDVVCNGLEMSSGAIRNHIPEIMYKAFEIAGYSAEDVDKKFAGMIKAFRYGAPPHGGMAPGIDRIIMLLTGNQLIRDVIAFPLAQTVEDLMMKAPSEVTEKQLKELHIRIVHPEKKPVI